MGPRSQEEEPDLIAAYGFNRPYCGARSRPQWAGTPSSAPLLNAVFLRTFWVRFVENLE